MNRQNFLKTLGLGAVSSVVGSSLLTGCNTHDMSAMNMTPGMENMGPSVTEIPFSTPLRFPETITGTSQLTAKSVSDAILPGKNARVLGYRGGMLGPTIRVQNGSDVSLRFTNNLDEESNIHWHGLLVPAEMDGHPTQLVQAGGAFTYTFRLNQAANMAWYHPHPHEKTGKQANLGLAGMIIVETPAERALNLPSGSYELPMVIQDKRLDGNGAPTYNPSIDDVMIGYMGETIIVNGVAGAVQTVSTRMYRLRVVNGSNGRIYNLALSNNAPFWIIGSDGGLLTAPEQVTALLLSPGERADLLVDFGKVAVGTDVFLKSNSFTGATSQGGQAFNILKFTVNKAETDPFQMPATLGTVLPLSTASATKTRLFDIGISMEGMNGMAMRGMHTIGGKTYLSSRIDESVKLGDTEIWEFDNSKGDEPHPMHLHGTFFQVLNRVGGRNALNATEKGWKDTVLVMPGERVRIIAQFTKPGTFVFHCHNLEHEDDGMMLNFRVS
ncbi:MULTISPECIES: multicopper oxidase family protein [unclassified Spirosoma]|uniref:multicopper oxidase family protein n=1 Tax=unclassified Spirosoma TaxID=2621999 RepID=UPI0009599C8A|nr:MULTISPECIES: multicopper oxidase domain-containing protein [unclassified Spirosoma]MBN8827051.1 multicopper oxidase domain-containing protein [Spirosoma sp.]OJW71408.1 MAG: bilirubin oxidase [Spirosoma sp. 48-14]